MLRQQRCWNKNQFTESLQLFVKGFLRFVVFVAVAQIKSMRTVADNVGADRHAVAALGFGPFFGGLQKLCAGSAAALPFSDDQSIHFSAQRNLEQRSDADVNPANNPTLGSLSNQDAAKTWMADQVSKARGHSFRRRWITQLSAEFGNDASIREAGPANYDFVRGARHA